MTFSSKIDFTAVLQYEAPSLCRSIVVYLKSPRRKSTTALYRGCSRYRCVPKMASPEARKCECTTAPQSHDPEIQVPSLVRGECTTAPQAGGERKVQSRARGGAEAGEGGEGGGEGEVGIK